MVWLLHRARGCRGTAWAMREAREMSVDCVVLLTDVHNNKGQTFHLDTSN